MDSVRFEGRDVIVWTMPEGNVQPFYRSTGRNSGMPGIWLPFDGLTMIFEKRRFCRHPNGDRIEGALHRYGQQKYKDASEAIEKLDLPEAEVVSGTELNEFLERQGWKIPWLHKIVRNNVQV